MPIIILIVCDLYYLLDTILAMTVMAYIDSKGEVIISPRAIFSNFWR